MKKQHYIALLAIVAYVGGVTAVPKADVLTGDKAREHYIQQYDDLIRRFDNECYLSPFSWLATKYQIKGCQELSNAIINENRYLFEHYNAEQSKHKGGNRGQAIEYWNKQK